MALTHGLARTLVDLADTLAEGFDVTDHLRTLTRRSGKLVGVAAAGLVMAGPEGRLQLAAHTTNRALELARAGLRSSQGPGLGCLTTGRQVANVASDEIAARWPLYSQALAASKFCSVHAVPLRLRGEVLGAMTLLCRDQLALSAEQLEAGQALADAATIGLLQHRALRQRDVHVEQLQYALDSRIVIEQAKAALAQRCAIDVDTAFAVMRNYARSHHQKIHLVAQAVIDQTIAPNTLIAANKAGI